VVVFNHSETTFKIKAGDRIAQLICEVIKYPEVLEVDELPTTERGNKGFGSSGTR